MNNYQVRLLAVSVNNFKNVEHGEITLNSNADNGYFNSADLLGIYGQNGSGKTSLIQVLDILKYILTGRSIPPEFGGFINPENPCSLEYRFAIRISDDCTILANYTVFLCLENAASIESNIDIIKDTDESCIKIKIAREKFDFKDTSANGTIMTTLIDCDFKAADVLFTPMIKVNEFTSKLKSIKENLFVNKALSYQNAQSFIFSVKSLQTFRKTCENIKYVHILEALCKYGNCDLFVISTRTAGLISLNAATPISIRHSNLDAKTLSVGVATISLNEPSLFPEHILNKLKEILQSMNIVLNAIIPGLTVEVVELGNQLLPDATKGCSFELVALRDGNKIPLKDESEGIRKIFSILQLLISVFNFSGVTVAIDELDSGVFEYLLGELLVIMAKSGKGQLIFTSHNLRPLEIIDSKFLCFTTTNKSDRYYKLKNIKTNNNVRDVYYRHILLGGQDEQLYDETKNAKISVAFRKAGEYFG